MIAKGGGTQNWTTIRSQVRSMSVRFYKNVAFQDLTPLVKHGVAEQLLPR